MSSWPWRQLAALLLGVVFASAAVYWFTIGRRPLEADDAGDELANDVEAAAA